MGGWWVVPGNNDERKNDRNGEKRAASVQEAIASTVGDEERVVGIVGWRLSLPAQRCWAAWLIQSASGCNYEWVIGCE